jgi:ATP-dependent RNA helicase RhlE
MIVEPDAARLRRSVARRGANPGRGRPDARHGADKIAKSLVKVGIQADIFHSNKSQSARQRVLFRFKEPQPLVLVATDIAARGLDINDVSHVVNVDLPINADSYIRRIGHTGRVAAALMR